MKKVITIVIVVLVCLGFGYFLFKISPQDEQQAASSPYQLSTSNAAPISAPPAFDPATDHYLGNPKAKNVFVEYGDMQCPACAQYNEITKQIPTTFTDTVYVFRYFPLITIHKNAVIGALAAEAAGAQGKYWEMHDILFAKQTDWETSSNPLDMFAQYAQQVGVKDIDQFKNDVTSQKYKSVVEKNNNEATSLNLQGTPTFYFNGHLIENQDLNGLKQESVQYLNSK